MASVHWINIGNEYCGNPSNNTSTEVVATNAKSVITVSVK